MSAGGNISRMSTSHYYWSPSNIYEVDLLYFQCVITFYNNMKLFFLKHVLKIC